MRPAVFILVGTVVLIISGCAVFSPKPFSPLEEDYPGGLTHLDILRILKERHGSFSHLWANGGITLSGGNLKGKKFFQATLLYQEPLCLRLRGSRMITSTLFEFLIHGDQVALAWNREKKWFQGTRAELEKYPEATFGMDPLLLPQALLIQQEFIRLLGEGRFEKCRQGNRDYVFVTKDPERKAFLVRKNDLLVREAALYSKEGMQKLKLRFKRYALSNGEILPVELEAFFPVTGLTARIEIREYKLPQTFQDAVFDLTPPPDFERHSLKDLFQPPSL